MAAETARAVAETIWTSLGGDAAALGGLSFTGAGASASAFPVSDFAAGAVAAAGLAVSDLLGGLPRVVVDRRLASFWFSSSLRPTGWEIPDAWNSIAGDYRAKDGWIRLHTNAPHHRAAAVRALGRDGERADIAAAVKSWTALDLETAVLAAGGCAAEMRDAAAWAAHPQGAALAAEPLGHICRTPARPFANWEPDAARPLKCLRVLDLTRVLAGPTSTRFLAGFGAEVLRIDPPTWDEPPLVPEMTLGKRCARLDLATPAGRAMFDALLAGADILVHGYRPGALAGLGYTPAALQAIAPGLIDIALDAYGWTGPWAGRRGFDSLVQMSSGIAAAGMAWKGADKPVPLPYQALDHATGYLLATAAVRGVGARLRGAGATTARVSLARTAKLLLDQGFAAEEPAFEPEGARDLMPGVERTPWGEAKRIMPPVLVEGAPMHWDRPASALGSAAPSWG